MNSPEGPPKANGLRVVVVEGNGGFHGSLALLVAREGLSVTRAATLEEARARLADERPDVMFLELGLRNGNGTDPAKSANGRHPDFVVISGNATIEAAVDALRQGGFDFLSKPVQRGRLREILAHVAHTPQLNGKVSILRGELRHLARFGPMVGRSPSMRRVYELIRKVAPTRASVLITGESGTGKELVSQTVHRMSPRATKPFLAVNCGAVAPNVIESELFGHERGSFTGAERGRKGYFEEANGGTLLLDEVTEMSADLQVKLLRVIDAGRLFRVGASEPISVDVRVIAATNRDPQTVVRQGLLREDLYYRLNVFQIEVPPLRERGEDILMLAENFLTEFNTREGTTKRWSERAQRRLMSYWWPGNVRELRNVVERAAILSGDVIADPRLPEGLPDYPPAGKGDAFLVQAGLPLSEVERRGILATLRMVQGDKREAARRLGISLKTLYTRLKAFKAAGRMEDTDRAAF
jgi:DNA-binding NtrC family response regulator